MGDFPSRLEIYLVSFHNFEASVFFTYFYSLKCLIFNDLFFNEIKEITDEHYYGCYF